MFYEYHRNPLTLFGMW